MRSLKWQEGTMQIKQKCPKCGKVLQILEYGKGEIKCPRCGQIVKYEYKGNEQRERQESS